jgi:ribose transport system permease protein
VGSANNMATTHSHLDAPELAAPPAKLRRARAVGSGLRLHQLSGVYVFVVIVIVFSYLAPETFPTIDNVRIVAGQQALTAMLAIALLIPFAAGVFDLSAANMMAFSAILCAELQTKVGMPILGAMAITLLAGLAVGCINAFLVVRLRVDSFIATLGMTSVLLAMGYIVTGSQDVVSGISPGLLKVGRFRVPGLDVQASVLFLIVLAAVIWYVLDRVPFGRYLYAIGDNPRAARLSGLRVDRITAASLIISALLATLIGFALLGQIGVASLNAGAPYLLPTISAIFLGSTQIKPGRMNVPGTLVAIFVLAAGVKGLQLTISAPWVSDLFVGVTLLLAVALAVKDRRAG